MLSRSLAEVENTSTVQKDDRIMEMKKNVEGKDNRIIELESRYVYRIQNSGHTFVLRPNLRLPRFHTALVRSHQFCACWNFHVSTRCNSFPLSLLDFCTPCKFQPLFITYNVYNRFCFLRAFARKSMREQVIRYILNLVYLFGVFQSLLSLGGVGWLTKGYIFIC